MRRLVGICGLLAAACFGQAPSEPRFRSATTLIEFPLVALDGRGSPIADLRKDEFTIVENGQERALLDLRFDGGSEPPAQRRLAAGMFTNRAEYLPGSPRNVVAIVMDALNTPADQQAAVRAQTLHYLTAFPPGIRVAVYQLSARLTVIHGIASDLDSVRARLEKLGTGNARTALTDAQFADLFNPGRSETSPRTDSAPGMRALASSGIEQDRSRRLDRTLAELEELGDALASVPGRKSLIWIGAGTPILSFSAPTPTDAKGWLTLNGPLLERAARRLATQGIAVYPVDAAGLVPPVSNPRPGPANPASLINSSRRESSMETVAEITGGRVIRNSNDPASGIRAAVADLRGAYTAAFYSDAPNDGQWHTISIKLKRKGVNLVYRQGYQAADASARPRDWEEAEWLSAISSPLGSSAVRLDVACELAVQNGSPELQARLQVPGQDLFFAPAVNERRAALEFALVERGQSGELHTQRHEVMVRFPNDSDRELATEVAQLSRSWKLGQGVTSVRFIARDRLSGRYGTVDVPLAGIPGSGEKPAVTAVASDPFIEKARAVSREFLDTLPNYVVKQITTRVSQASANRWNVQDRIAAEIVYERGKETTRDVRLNGKPAAPDAVEQTGAWSTGQFGGMLNALFSPDSAAVFRLRHGTTHMAGREAVIYDFSVERANSSWQLSAGPRKYLAAYDGVLWLDRETARTLKFQMRARDLPADFPLDQAESSTEYRFVKIGGAEYLMPTASVALICSRLPPAITGRGRGPSGPPHYCGRNVIEFQGYKQFGTESNISFDPPK